MKYRKKKQQTPEKKLDISKEKFENRMQGREQSGIHGAVTRH